MQLSCCRIKSATLVIRLAMESLIKPPAAPVANVFRAILPDVDPDSVRRFPVRGQNDLNIATPGQSAW